MLTLRVLNVLSWSALRRLASDSPSTAARKRSYREARFKVGVLQVLLRHPSTHLYSTGLRRRMTRYLFNSTKSPLVRQLLMESLQLSLFDADHRDRS